MKKVMLEVPNDTIAGSVTIVLTSESGYGMELLTRNFDFQIKNGASLLFERDVNDGCN